MSLFDRFKKKNQIGSVKKDKSAKETVLSQAEEAARIVEDGLNNGDYSDMNAHLINLYNQQAPKEHFVFKQPNKIGLLLVILICLVLCILYLPNISIGSSLSEYTKDYAFVAETQWFTSAAVIAINISIAYAYIKRILYYKRYTAYLELFERRSIEFTAVISDYINRPIKLVIKDLKKAIKLGLIPQGHFTKDNIVFMVSDELFFDYIKNQEAHDKYYSKILDEKERKDNQSSETKTFIENGRYYLRVIKDSNAIIKNKSVSEKLDRLEKTVEMIIREIDINPFQIDKLRIFINYYLPTTEKLLDAYIDVDKTYGKSSNATIAKREIISSLDTINNAFESILDQLYKEIEKEIFINSTTMEKMMQLEGIVEYDPNTMKRVRNNRSDV